MVELGGGHVARASQALFGDLLTEPVETGRRKLAEALGALEQPVIVILDDLDRLDRDELVAVLRSVRLLSDLPNLTQLLAYDREQIARTLFPADPTGTRARDHLGKIVNIEIPIGSPPRELIRDLFDRPLALLVTALGPEDARQFQERIRGVSLTLLAQALPTPREVRRVAATTASRWERMAGHLNAFDLFILTILQYRSPDVYRTIRAHPEWFVELQWSHTLDFRLGDSQRKAQEQYGRDYLESLETEGGPEGAVAAGLLRTIFYTLRRVGSGGLDLEAPIGEEAARRGRRLVHPRIIERYFHLYVPHDVVSEAEIEQYADLLRDTPAGRGRQQALAEIVGELAKAERLDSFLDQWNLVFGRHPREGRYEPSLVQDLVIGLAQSAHLFSERESFLGYSQMTFAAFKVLFLSFHLSDQTARTGLLGKAIRQATSLSFAGSVVLYSAQDRVPEEYSDCPDAETRALEAELAEKMVTTFSGEEAMLLRLSLSEREAIFRTGEDPGVRDLIVRALEQEPELLPRLLELGAPVALTEQGAVVKVESFEPQRLAERVDLKAISELTKELPLETWADKSDQVLVERLRKWARDQKAGGPNTSPHP